MTTLWDGAEVISTYTDAQAQDDGALVAVTKRDRVTRAVWEWLARALPEGAKPPTGWPVEMMGWFRPQSLDERALALARGLILCHGARAREVYEKNLGGGIFKLHAEETDGKIRSLDADAEGKGRWLWLLPNEMGGLTLMFPEDY